MTLFTDSGQLKATLHVLFDYIAKEDAVVRSLATAKLIIRLQITQPDAAVVFNGRKNPPAVTYDAAGLSPDLDITLSAETLHQILLRETRLRTALAAGQLRVRGPVWKSFIMEDIFHSAQARYPQVLREMGLFGPDGG